MQPQQIEIFFSCDCGEAHRSEEMSVVVTTQEVTRDYAHKLLAKQIKRYMSAKNCRHPAVLLVGAGLRIVPEVH